MLLSGGVRDGSCWTHQVYALPAPFNLLFSEVGVLQSWVRCGELGVDGKCDLTVALYVFACSHALGGFADRHSMTASALVMRNIASAEAVADQIAAGSVDI